jgi:hypothetical protein
MTINEETLKRNDICRWTVGDVELTSGSIVEINIDGVWLKGTIEYWHSEEDYYWFSFQDGVPVILNSGIRARLSTHTKGVI